MSTPFLEAIFPEMNWSELKSEMYGEIFEKLSNTETLYNEVASYLRFNKIRIGFHKQYKSGGGWTLLRNITLSPGDDPLNPYVLSLIIHETYHLKQTLWERLSMQGELRAWQYQKMCYREITGRDIGDVGEAYMGTKVYWDELDTLSSYSRDDLMRAQEVMRKISPSYRSDMLPLYPLGQEIKYLLSGRFGEAFSGVMRVFSSALELLSYVSNPSAHEY